MEHAVSINYETVPQIGDKIFFGPSQRWCIVLDIKEYHNSIGQTRYSVKISEPGNYFSLSTFSFIKSEHIKTTSFWD